jgi:glucokinase
MTAEQCFIGVDLGGTNLKFALVDNAGKMLERKTIKTESHLGHDSVIERMIAGIKEIAAAAPGEVGALGMAIPGELDMDRGIVNFLTNFPGHWPGIPVGEPVKAATGLPAFIINDVRAFTVGELEMGAARGVTTAICYAVGTGIGGGIVAHGQLNLGVGGAGGELGHIIVDPTGPKCGCGNRGCIEAFAAGPSIAGEAIRRLMQGVDSSLREMVGNDFNKMTPTIVEKAAGAGDAVAIEILEYAGYHFGLGVAGAISSIGPEVVVIGGGNVTYDGVFWRAIESTARANCHLTDMTKVTFKPAQLGYDAGVIGAALWGRKMLEREGK